MATQIGVWIDQREAKIVLLNADEASLTRIESEVERDQKNLGDVGAGQQGGRAPTAEPKHLEHRREQEMKEFLKQVVAAIAKADELIIMGPGMVKTRLAKRLEEERLADKVRKVDSAPTGLTDAQLKKHVKEMFGKPDPRVQRG